MVVGTATSFTLARHRGADADVEVDLGARHLRRAARLQHGRAGSSCSARSRATPIRRTATLERRRADCRRLGAAPPWPSPSFDACAARRVGRACRCCAARGAASLCAGAACCAFCAARLGLRCLLAGSLGLALATFRRLTGLFRCVPGSWPCRSSVATALGLTGGRPPQPWAAVCAPRSDAPPLGSIFSAGADEGGGSRDGGELPPAPPIPAPKPSSACRQGRRRNGGQKRVPHYQSSLKVPSCDYASV